MGLVTFLVALAMVAGLIGTVLPLIPGIPIIWAAALVYGLVEGFGGVGVAAMVLITAVGATGLVAGLVLPHRTLAASGAPRSTVFAGVVGALLGFFLIPVVGLVAGGVVAIYAMELRRTGDPGVARAGTVTLLKGFGLGILVELVAGTVMIVAWIVWVIAG